MAMTLTAWQDFQCNWVLFVDLQYCGISICSCSWILSRIFSILISFTINDFIVVVMSTIMIDCRWYPAVSHHFYGNSHNCTQVVKNNFLTFFPLQRKSCSTSNFSKKLYHLDLLWDPQHIGLPLTVLLFCSEQAISVSDILMSVILSYTYLWQQSYF